MEREPRSVRGLFADCLKATTKSSAEKELLRGNKYCDEEGIGIESAIILDVRDEVSNDGNDRRQQVLNTE